MDMIEAKRVVGRKAAELIERGMIVGLGTGSTSERFIEALGERIKQDKLNIRAVASSRTSAEMAKKAGIPLIDINDAPRIDLTIDGADEIDPQKRMIKGGGGALLREKILALASGELIVIVDEAKWVNHLGRSKLPVEILYYGSPSTRRKLEALGYKGKWRLNSDNTFYLTENGNLIFDIEYTVLPFSPESEQEKMLRIPGVIETGFFINIAGRVLTGFDDGHVEMK